jgi:hypothetical protein
MQLSIPYDHMDLVVDATAVKKYTVSIFRAEIEANMYLQNIGIY